MWQNPIYFPYKQKKCQKLDIQPRLNFLTFNNKEKQY